MEHNLLSHWDSFEVRIKSTIEPTTMASRTWVWSSYAGIACKFDLSASGTALGSPRVRHSFRRELVGSCTLDRRAINVVRIFDEVLFLLRLDTVHILRYLACQAIPPPPKQKAATSLRRYFYASGQHRREIFLAIAPNTLCQKDRVSQL